MLVLRQARPGRFIAGVYTLIVSDSTGGDSTGSTAVGLLETLVKAEGQVLAGDPALPGRHPSAGPLSAAWGRLMARASATVTAQ